jgi:hypothetical protein
MGRPLTGAHFNIKPPLNEGGVGGHINMYKQPQSLRRCCVTAERRLTDKNTLSLFPSKFWPTLGPRAESNSCTGHRKERDWGEQIHRSEERPGDVVRSVFAETYQSDCLISQHSFFRTFSLAFYCLEPYFERLASPSLVAFPFLPFFPNLTCGTCGTCGTLMTPP